jgi:hypothetical protein
VKPREVKEKRKRRELIVLIASLKEVNNICYVGEIRDDWSYPDAR